MRTRVVLVRHGESQWNAAKRLQGFAGPGLTERGRAEACAVAAHLRRLAPRASLLVRSDLPRVAETAAPTAVALDVAVEVDERLREIDVGTWSGLTWDQVEARDGDTLRAWRRGIDVRRGGGETFGELRARVWRAVRDLAGRGGGGPVLVFTHGGPIRVAVAALLGLPPLGENRLAPVGNASMTELELDDDAGMLRSYDRRGHLDAPDDAAWP